MINKMATNKFSSTREHLFKVLVIGEFGVDPVILGYKPLGSKAKVDKGKTSIIKRYVEGSFNPNYKLTIGVDFALKTLEWDSDTKVNLQLWDIAGHERFGHMTRVYYKYAGPVVHVPCPSGHTVTGRLYKNSILKKVKEFYNKKRPVQAKDGQESILYTTTPPVTSARIAAIIVFDLSRPATFDSIPKWLNDVNSKVMLSNEEPVPVILLANKCDVEDVTVDKHKIDDFCKTHNIVNWFQTSAKDNVNIDEAMKLLIDYILKLPAENQQPEEHIALTSRNNSYNSGHAYEESFEEDDSEVKKKSSCCT